MESRKRRHGEESESLHPNKRALMATNGIHDTNSNSDSEEPVDDNLEMFRKEAIFRQMKHYSRENERSKTRIAELERRKTTCEAGLAAMSACWNQLVDAIRLLAKPEDLPPVDARTREMFDLSIHVSDDSTELSKALEDNMQATQSLVVKLMQLGGTAVLQSDTYSKCQKAQTECSTLRSEVDLLRAKLEDSESQKQKYHEALVVAETRADRLRSATVLAMQARAHVPTPEKEPEVEEPPPVVSSPVQQPEPNGHVAAPSLDEKSWEAIAAVREDTIKDLQEELNLARETFQSYKEDYAYPPDTIVKSTVTYKVVVERCSYLEHIMDTHKSVLQPLREELLALQTTRKEFEEGVNAAAAFSLQEFKNMMAKREIEAVRLRDQREQLTSELNERKHKETVKLASMQELKTLADSRADRIAILQAELARHKAQLAANASNEDLMNFLFQNQSEDASYIEDLRARLRAAEERVMTMEASFSCFQEDHPDIMQHMRAEAEALQKLAEANRELEKYQAVYGNASTLAPDVQSLTEHLRQRDEESTKLKTLEAHHALAETSLYAELEKLSTAWEDLENQVKSKIFDLSVMEEKLTKSSVDRAKSENKYYQIMREKEAIENERKNALRNLEKQGKAVERLLDLEKNLTSQINALERELALAKSDVRKKIEMVEQREEDIVKLRHQVEGERRKYHEFRTSRIELDRTMDTKQNECRKAEERFIRKQKELEHTAATAVKVKAPSNLSSSQKEAQLQGEVDKCMSILKCSTCHLNMRSTVITSCMHSFCKGCVDARIATRQRKCPACQLPFGKPDVKQLYFQ